MNYLGKNRSFQIITYIVSLFQIQKLTENKSTLSLSGRNQRPRGAFEIKLFTIKNDILVNTIHLKLEDNSPHINSIVFHIKEKDTVMQKQEYLIVKLKMEYRS